MFYIDKTRVQCYLFSINYIDESFHAIISSYDRRSFSDYDVVVDRIEDLFVKMGYKK